MDTDEALREGESATEATTRQEHTELVARNADLIALYRAGLERLGPTIDYSSDFEQLRLILAIQTEFVTQKAFRLRNLYRDLSKATHPSRVSLSSHVDAQGGLRFEEYSSEWARDALIYLTTVGLYLLRCLRELLEPHQADDWRERVARLEKRVEAWEKQQPGKPG